MEILDWRFIVNRDGKKGIPETSVIEQAMAEEDGTEHAHKLVESGKCGLYIYCCAQVRGDDFKYLTRLCTFGISDEVHGAIMRASGMGREFEFSKN